MSRRPADDIPNGQSDAKKPRVEPPKATLDIAAIRAQIAAKKAALEASGSGSGASSPAPSRPAGPAALPPTPTMDASVAERLAAAKARIEALNSRAKNPYLASTPAPAPAPVALHPLLTQQAGPSKDEKNDKKRERERYKTMAPKFSTVKANVVATPAPVAVAPTPAPSLNPYAAAASTAAPDDAKAASRRSKKLQFAQPGRYVKQGDQLRNEEKMEALRQRIAEASKKAGLDSEFDTLERSLKVGLLL